MHEYSQLAQEKLCQQAARGLDEIRCPLDGAIMMVIGGVACRTEKGKQVYRDFQGQPRNPAWTVVTVQLECSACRRRLSEVSVVGEQPELQNADPTFQLLS
jgi:hypothetical protein